MTYDDFARYLDQRGIMYDREGSAFCVGGYLYLGSLTTLPEGVSLSAGGYLDLGSLTTLPEGVSLGAGGSLDLRSLTTLPEGVSLSAGGYLYLRSLTTLPEGVSLSAGGYLDLGSLTTLPEGVSLGAGGSLDLRSLTTLPEGVSLSAGGYLYLRSLTTLPEGVSLSAGSYLYFGSLTSEEQTYQGRRIRIRTVDGYAMRLIAKRRVGEVTVWSAQYFRGSLDSDRRCYVAEQDGLTAHGDTAEEAMRDLRFKAAQRDYDPEELVAEIKRRGTVSFNDYRLLTGACAEGLREGLRQRGIDPDTEELPLPDVLTLCADGYGGAQFRRLMEAA